MAFCAILKSAFEESANRKGPHCNGSMHASKSTVHRLAVENFILAGPAVPA